MRELGEVKGLEREIYGREIEKRSTEIKRVEGWVGKRKELEEAVRRVEEGEGGKRLNRVVGELEGVEVPHLAFSISESQRC